MLYNRQEVLAEIADVEYLLPEKDHLIAMLRERKLTPVPVVMQRYADFVTGTLEGFLRFVRASNIRAVMYTYSYYGEQDLAEMFQLEDNDRSLFAVVSGKPTAYDMYEARRNKTKVYEGTDYSSYLRYSKFVQENVDLSHPKELRLYSLVQGKIVACQLGDAWLERISLPNRMSLRRYAMEQNLGRGDLPFKFF